MNKKKNEIKIRSSVAEYLTYVAAIGDNPESIEVRYEIDYDKTAKATIRFFTSVQNKLHCNNRKYSNRDYIYISRSYEREYGINNM